MGLTLALIRNPGVVGEGLLENIISNHAFYGPVMVRSLEKQFNESLGDVSSVLGIIDIFESIVKRSNWGSGFQSVAIESSYILEQIKEKNKNYFVAERLNLLNEFLEGDYFSKKEILLDKYSNNSLSKDAPEPLGAKHYNKPEDFIDQCTFANIDQKYGVIYNPKGEIDSFFSKEASSENLRLEEILEKEAPEIYQKMDKKQKEFLVDNYKALLNVFFRDKIENEFSIKLNQLNIREQIQFVNFISVKSVEEMEIIKNSITISKEDNARISCLKSFLSLEYDRNNGEKIIEIAQKLEKMEAQKVFAKISELGDLAQKKDEELSKIIYKDNQKELPASVQTELLRKAHNIISRFSDELKGGEKMDGGKIQKLLADLEQSRIEIDLVASLLIAGKKEGEAQNLEDIKGLEISEISGEEVLENSELIGKLREMYRVNNSHKSKEDLERLISDFEKHLKYEAKFYVVYFDKDGKGGDKKLENLVGFMRSSNFDGMRKIENNERYLGAMNIDPLLQKFYFGENFLRETIKKEFQFGAQKIVAHMPKDGPSHKIIKTLDVKREEMPAGNYKLEDGREIERLLVELTKKSD